LRCRGVFTYESMRQLVGLLGRVIGPTQGLYLHRTTQHRETQTHIHAPSRIRTCDLNIRAAEDSTCLRPRGHWDRPLENLRVKLCMHFSSSYRWYMLRASHLFRLINLIIFGKEKKSWSLTLYRYLHTHATFWPLDLNNLLSNLFSNRPTINLCSSLWVSDQVSYPYKKKEWCLF
jgi:hypothetical protein